MLVIDEGLSALSQQPNDCLRGAVALKENPLYVILEIALTMSQSTQYPPGPPPP